MAKTRLDVMLVERGFFDSREKARAVIMAGDVFVNGQRSDKPGNAYGEDVSIEVRGGTLKYVSRGGLKLERALDFFGGNPKGAIFTSFTAVPGVRPMSTRRRFTAPRWEPTCLMMH